MFVDVHTTLNTPISECGKLVKVVLNSFTLSATKRLGSILYLGNWHYSPKTLALGMKVQAFGTNH